MITRAFAGGWQCVTPLPRRLAAPRNVILVESGGDNLSATFSPELVDAFIYVIDVAQGDKIPRKGGPAIRNSDLLLINKVTLAHHVSADLSVMERDSRLMRGSRPFLFCDLKSGQGLPEVVEWVERDCLFAAAPSPNR